MDEITALSIDLRAKLLRTLQERKFRRVGGRELIEVDFRAIAATNHDPEEAVADGQFRPDLFYRLNVVPIKVPPLRDRREDLPSLVDHFLAKLNNRHPARQRSIASDVLERMEHYHWPGNVRELQNVVERLFTLSDADDITFSELPTVSFTAPPTEKVANLSDLPFKEAKRRWVETFERQYLEQNIAYMNGNISKAAEFIGLDRKTIHRMLKKLDLGR